MAKNNVWLSVSDLMTGLMIIFLFVAIAYMIRVDSNQSVLTEYVETKQSLHAKLVQEFEGDTARWQMAIGKDLSMKFNNPQVLFATGSYQLTPTFCEIIDEFIPRYLSILLEDSLANKIKEIRIEGHTDDVPAPQFGTDPFLANIKLSQLRSYSVLEYIRNMESYQRYTDEQKKEIGILVHRQWIVLWKSNRFQWKICSGNQKSHRQRSFSKSGISHHYFRRRSS